MGAQAEAGTRSQGSAGLRKQFFCSSFRGHLCIGLDSERVLEQHWCGERCDGGWGLNQPCAQCSVVPACLYLAVDLRGFQAGQVLGRLQQPLGEHCVVYVVLGLEMQQSFGCVQEPGQGRAAA